MAKTRYRTDRMTYQDAERIVGINGDGQGGSFSRDSRYMKSLVAKYTDGAFADSLDYRDLLAHALKIKAIAGKLIRTKPKTPALRESESPGIELSVQDKPHQGSLF